MFHLTLEKDYKEQKSTGSLWLLTTPFTIFISTIHFECSNVNVMAIALMLNGPKAKKSTNLMAVKMYYEVVHPLFCTNGHTTYQSDILRYAYKIYQFIKKSIQFSNIRFQLLRMDFYIRQIL